MRRTNDWGKIRLSLLTVFAAAFMFLTVSFESFAAEGTVIANSAKIRAAASTSSDHVGSAAKGEKFTITGQENGADGKVWYQITFGENKSGFIRSDLMNVSGDVPAEQPAAYNPTVAVTDLNPVNAIVTGSSVRVRPDAAASGGVVASVVRDTTLTIDGMATGSDGKVWYRINSTVDGKAVYGFVREDFVNVQGELTPPSQVETPPVQEPAEQPAEPAATPEPKKYETVYENDKWYLMNNEANEKYVIDDMFSAVSTNAELAKKSEETVKSQKGIIGVLVVLLLVALGGVCFLVWKLREMMDEAYFKQVEKKTLHDRAKAPKKVMQTVGDERKVPGGQPVRKPASGQPQRTGQRPAGEGVRKPAGQSRPAGDGVRKPVNRPEGAQAGKPVQQRPDGAPVKKKAPSQPQVQQQAPKAAAPQQKSQGFQPKNFMADDDEFEFEFLNKWDCDDEE